MRIVLIQVSYALYKTYGKKRAAKILNELLSFIWLNRDV